jgi:putative nucleotidyltransferase with HDIG domain
MISPEILELWPELEWISNPELREKTAGTWELALNKSVLTSADLKRIPFTLLAGADLKVTFMEHKRSVVHIAFAAGNTMNSMYHGELPVNMDVLIAGAILADVGKLLEYEVNDSGHAFQGKYGKLLRHPFIGVSLAEQCGVHPEVCHIIAAHADEGNLVNRSVEAMIVHYADFMTFLPFKSKLET